ncbi:MAG: hypothetical protein JNN12_17270 [Bacteroidetes Order II. Incertae sedis bacterium]|nr:hypothetical protein [Bacteroidetes Order II. bacterium]
MNFFVRSRYLLMLVVLVSLVLGIGSAFWGVRGAMYGILSFSAFLILLLLLGLYQKTLHRNNRVGYLMAFCLMLVMSCFWGILSLEHASESYFKPTPQEKGQEYKPQVHANGSPESRKVYPITPSALSSPQQMYNRPRVESKSFKESGLDTNRGIQASILKTKKEHKRAKTSMQIDEKPVTASKNVRPIPTPTFILQEPYPENQ